MNDDQVRRTIEELEGSLACDDPALLKRFRALRRADIVNVLSVFALIAAGTVLLTVGLATRSWPLWTVGVAAFLTSFVVDEHHKRTLRRNP
ncbi:MAG TPA: DUF3040 domain-containing protein [Acidimicrobiales bacterium]|jgi:hypothetical protein